MAWDSTDTLPARVGVLVPEDANHVRVPAPERRREYRRRVYKGATIKFHGGYCAMQCIVVDLSPSGARLSFGDTTGVPPHFEIRIFGEEKWRRAEVRWRKPDCLGIALSPLH